MGAGPRFGNGVAPGQWGARFTDRGNVGRDITGGKHGRHHARHRSRGSIAGYDYYSNFDCYRWRQTPYGWQWVNVCYRYY